MIFEIPIKLSKKDKLEEKNLTDRKEEQKLGWTEEVAEDDRAKFKEESKAVLKNKSKKSKSKK